MQINSLLSEKNKLMGDKNALERYCEEQMMVVNNNYLSEREKLVKRVT